MANTVYITAGLSIPKDGDQTQGVNTAYITAGLEPEPYAPPPPKAYFKLGGNLIVTGVVT